jgi:hypothetical protein
MKNFLKVAAPFVAIAAMSAVMVGCGPQQESSTQIERRKQEELSLQAVQSVGMPAITNFAEKRMFKDILELRDKNTPTTTYLVGMNNQLTKVCDSIGFGLPYATQYTNPMRLSGDGTHGYTTLPQADPNGLYSPASAEGTWVLCVDHKDGKAKPVYIEPRILVSPFPIQ